MAAFFGTLANFSRTFGTTMNGEVQKVMFSAKARKYGSDVAFALDGKHEPIAAVWKLNINNFICAECCVRYDIHGRYGSANAGQCGHSRETASKSNTSETH